MRSLQPYGEEKASMVNLTVLRKNEQQLTMWNSKIL